MFQIAVAFAMMVVSALITASMMPKPKAPEAGKLDVPIANEGDSIPVCFGTNIIKRSNVVWYGDARTEAIKTKSGKK